MKITIKENNIATIQDQLDEMGVFDVPFNASKILFHFHLQEEESDHFNEMQVESLLWNLYDYGVITDPDVEYEITKSLSSTEYKVVIDIQ